MCPNFGALSVSTLATFASLSRRFATSSKIGSIIWQGPHHLAVVEKKEDEIVESWKRTDGGARIQEVATEMKIEAERTAQETVCEAR